jgi:ABC-2 type transport system ATP-binding protein
VKRRRDDLLRRVGLADWGKTSVRKYSKGMLQRLGLAQAMLHDPDVLILDEPTDGVDPVGRSEMRGLLQSLKDEGKTIFINSHLLQEVELVCDRVAILVQGELQRVGTVEEITERDAEEITFAVGGEAATARAAIDFAQPTNWLSAEGGHTFTVAAADQQAINRCIDALRTARVDILSMTRERTSLEDAFLDIVARQRNEAADAEVIEVTPKEGESPA